MLKVHRGLREVGTKKDWKFRPNMMGIIIIAE
jgi:hypothetical protein